VTGLLLGVSKGYFKRIHAALAAAGPGYRVRAVVVDASWCGVPQARQRVFFLGLRRDLGAAAPDPPAPLPQRWTLRDALEAPPALEVTAEDRRMIRCGPAVAAMARRLHPGEHTDGRRLHLQRPSRRPGRAPAAPMFNLEICPWDKPVKTVCGQQNSAACLLHPDRRYFTLAELRRLCGYPDDYVLTGAYRQRTQRLGQSVPPPMMARVAGAVAETLRAVDARGAA
jgi:DNA (cytosine-5)-methyltransferase 1